MRTIDPVGNGRNPVSNWVMLKRILDEMSDLPDFVGISLDGPNTKGNFGNTPLHVAAVRGDVIAGRVLLECGANPNVRGEHGYTPLHEAAGQENTAFVKMLLDYGVDLSVTNDEGETAADIARSTENIVLQQILEKT
jgi:ankyrin repeat protein